MSVYKNSYYHIIYFRKPPKCPSVGNWLNTYWYFHIVLLLNRMNQLSVDVEHIQGTLFNEKEQECSETTTCGNKEGRDGIVHLSSLWNSFKMNSVFILLSHLNTFKMYELKTYNSNSS